VNNGIIDDILYIIDQSLEILKLIKGCIQYVSGINSTNEVFNENIRSANIFTSDNKMEEIYANNSIVEIMINLLNIAYCPIENDLKNNRDHWEYEIINVYRNDLIKLLKWGLSPNNDLITIINQNINDSYKVAINLFQRKYQNTSKDLFRILELIPSNCPWSLRELIDYELEDLLADLNDNYYS
jgi:hypothetical protein